MQARVNGQISVYDATVMLVGPVNVLFAGTTKSTWNLKRFKVVEVFSSMWKLGEPWGGGVGPSRSEGRKNASAVERWKQTAVADCPASIRVRSMAQVLAPMKKLPFGNV